MGAYSCNAWEYVRPAVGWQWTPGFDSDNPAFRPRVTLFLTNSLTVYHFFFRGLCLQLLQSVSPSSLWLVRFFFCGGVSPTATTAPSLRALVSSNPAMFRSIQAHPKFFLSLSLAMGAGASTLPAPALSAVSFSVSEGVDPFTMSNP
jgi:hypothetical protein